MLRAMGRIMRRLQLVGGGTWLVTRGCARPLCFRVGVLRRISRNRRLRRPRVGDAAE